MGATTGAAATKLPRRALSEHYSHVSVEEKRRAVAKLLKRVRKNRKTGGGTGGEARAGAGGEAKA